MTRRDAQELLKKYRSGTLTDEERAILESWYLQQARSTPALNLSDEDIEDDLAKISKRLPGSQRPVRSIFYRRYFQISLAAASIFLIAAVGLFSDFENSKPQVAIQQASKEKVLPGDKKAILTLADNTQIVLDGTSPGDLAAQQGITVSMTAKGQLIYKVNDKHIPADAPVQFNTISTPRGGEYQVQLPDGTTAWLNALSSIYFPTTFRGRERRVEVTGEVYFEVAKDAARPFRVVSGRQVTEVLGTHFNVNAYPDERAVKTTLLEGSVKVYLQDGKNPRVLVPGEQATMAPGADRFAVETVDLEEAVAWKNGYFIFTDEELTSVMRKIARWYDVEVDYQGVNKSIKFGGAVSRSRELVQVLDLLSLTDNIVFKVEGRRVIVMQ